MFFNQSGFSVKFEWGASGLDALGSTSASIVVVDVLSFSTCVDIATSRGAILFPYPDRDDSVSEFAERVGAHLASNRRDVVDNWSLSPASMRTIPSGTRLVLPSPNGGAICAKAAKYGTVICACLRNALAVASFIMKIDGDVLVIACGERWGDRTLRPSWEDLIGAGAVISQLPGRRSPEAELASNAFIQAKATLSASIHACSSGRELIERGFAADVTLAAEYGVSDCVPVLTGGMFTDRVFNHASEDG